MKRITSFHIIAIVWGCIALFAARKDVFPAEPPPQYELLMVTWYGEHAHKRTQLYKVYRKLRACKIRAKKIEASWNRDDTNFVGFTTCLEIKP